MQLDSEEGRLIKGANALLVVTTAGMVEYVNKEDASLCPQNKAKPCQRGSRQKCSAAGIYRNVVDVIGPGIDFKSMDNKIYREKEESKEVRCGTELEQERPCYTINICIEKLGSIKKYCGNIKRLQRMITLTK